MRKFIILEGIDACGKTFLCKKIESITENKIVEVNRNTNLSLKEKDLLTFNFSKSWFSGRTYEISPHIKSYISVIQLRYLYEYIVKPSLKSGDDVIADSWWGKSVCNIQYQNLHNHNFDIKDLIASYEMIGQDALNDMKTYYLRFDNPRDAYKIYLKKNSPETILGKNKFDEDFYLQYVSGFQSMMDELAKKYNFSIINMKYFDSDVNRQFLEIAKMILKDLNN